VLRANVTSPNGTTAAAIASMDSSAIRDAVISAMAAARDRSIELSGS
jgi:pyrroline-5-carboxylate reductase